MTPCFSKPKMPLIARHAIIYVPSRKPPSATKQWKGVP